MWSKVAAVGNADAQRRVVHGQLESATDFIAKLERLETDDLPPTSVLQRLLGCPKEKQRVMVPYFPCSR